MLASFSGVGRCYDNAPMESLWAALKTEQVYRQHYYTRAEAKIAILAYIEGWYNRQRRHSSLGYLNPQQFEHQSQCSRRPKPSVSSCSRPHATLPPNGPCPCPT